MDLDGEHRISAPADAVWRAVNDPAVLAACIPGCESCTDQGGGRFAATVAVRVGSLAARFSGTVQIEDADAGRSYTLAGQGQGGVAGFVRGRAQVTMDEDDGGTVLRWQARAEIGGRLASVGGRLLHGFAKKTAAEFFDRLGKRLAES
ncbi:MAG: CoxG family protein [Actinomycetota bacterium]